MRVLVLVVLLAGCGHRTIFELADVKTGRDGDRNTVALEVVCKHEIGNTCSNLGRFCVTAEWISGGAVVEAARTCHANTLRHGDRQPLRIISGQAVPHASDVRLQLAAENAGATRGVHELPLVMVAL
jgi:hypothetical protein